MEKCSYWFLFFSLCCKSSYLNGGEGEMFTFPQQLERTAGLDRMDALLGSACV